MKKRTLVSSLLRRVTRVRVMTHDHQQALVTHHSRDLILGDDALLYITYEMLIWAPLIPATRWSCRRPPSL